MADMGGGVAGAVPPLALVEKRAPCFSMRPSTDLPPVYPWWRPRPFA